MKEECSQFHVVLTLCQGKYYFVLFEYKAGFDS